MATKRLSSGFAGAETRGMSELDREIEMRLAGKPKRLDTFTDDFGPPGTGEFGPGADPSKPGASGGYGKKHEDTTPEADPSFTLAAAGNAREQNESGTVDADVQKYNAHVKKYGEQFPGAQLGKQDPASPNAAFDIHQTDPTRLRKEIKHDLAIGKPVSWECGDCGKEKSSVNTPARCSCGANKWKKK